VQEYWSISPGELAVLISDTAQRQNIQFTQINSAEKSGTWL
jgi:hypothetical protein